ncbi:glycoside hydrolase family 19 protein [Aeromonas hydrophila]|uniref:glycoside hydrolase family 19 protein n=1 Tax=Aeromonas hydrophila TaxID=644 RepID=UPI002B49A7C1|nr:glycoside hydrolase family 19 protein [Aeromonas hydrophila]
MKFAFPILTATGEEFKDVKALTALINGEQSGHYLLGNHNKWHGGIHISDKSAPWCKDKYPVRAMADGKVVAFRMMKDYLTSEFQGESLRYSNCFCLVQHEYCEINAETKAKNEFTFYSLYMHLLPWNQCQTAEKLLLKKGWNARNSVPHANPDAEQQRVDAALPRFTLPKNTELEMDSNMPPQKGSVGGKEYDFIKVTIKSKLSNTQIKEAEKAGVVVSQGSSVWIANSPEAVTFIKPNVPNWLFDQIDAELRTNMVGRADPVVNGPTGRLMVGDKSVSLPAGTKLQYDAHRLEFHWDGDKALKMARCNYVTPDTEGAAGGSGMAWVCVEDKFIKAKTLPPSHLGELYVLPSPVAIAAGETIGYLGLVETPGSLIGGKKSKHQVHLEVFTQDPRLDDVLANKAGTKGGATYAKVPAELVLYEKKKQDGKDLWVATADKSLEALIESPGLEKDAAKQEWFCVSSGKYVKKEQVALLSQHDWLKIGFKKVDGSGSDGYLDPDAPPTFFTNLVKSFDSDGNGELSSEEIQAALQNSSNAEKLQKLIVKHSSEWYEKSSASSYLWLDKLMTKIGLPDFDLLVDHEKQRIDKLEWMQSAAKLKLDKEAWHFSPVGMMEMGESISLTSNKCKKCRKDISLSFEFMRAFTPSSVPDSQINDFITTWNNNLSKYGISSCEQVINLLGQGKHETKRFTAFRESLVYKSYTAKSLYNMAPTAINNGFVRKGLILSREEKMDYIKRHLLNNDAGYGEHAFGSNEFPGKDYRGRGLLHLTHAENYRLCALATGLNIYTNPELVENNMPAIIESGFWFWNSNKLGLIADNKLGSLDKVKEITKIINPGMKGIEERIKFTEEARKLYIGLYGECN